jgi:hypothetical protein
MVDNNFELKNVYLDTQVFQEGNFNFRSKRFKDLSDLCKSGKVRLLLTEIVVREVKNRISEEARKAINIVEKSEKAIRILKNLDVPPFRQVLVPLDKKIIIKTLIDQFDQYISEANATVLKCGDVKIEPVLNNYFEQKPPFAEGKKKHEFPDAISLEAVRNWAVTSKEDVCVISGDQGVKDACEADGLLHAFAKLEEILDLIARQEKLADYASSLFAKNSAEVKNVIKSDFEGGGFYLEDEDGDVDRVEVLEIELDEEYLLKVDDKSATFRVTAEVKFSAQISFGDPDTGIWDGEVGVMTYIDTVYTTVTREASFPAEISLKFDIQKPDFAEIHSISINNNDSFGINVDE